MNESVIKLSDNLGKLSVFRNILNTDVVIALRELLSSLDELDYLAETTFYKGSYLSQYGELCRAIYDAGGDLGLFVLDFVRSGDDFYFRKLKDLDETSSSLKELNRAAEIDMETLQQLSELTPWDVLSCFNVDGLREQSPDTLPGWTNTQVLIRSEVLGIMSDFRTRGYGIFREASMFKVRDGKLIPVMNPDYQKISQLYEYERERNMVLQNTEALATGKAASNVLLYGDAGTGKSTTVKAAAAAYFDEGVRLVEFNKSQVGEIPAMAEKLYGNPLKFIFFIDDLTFTENDSDYYALKGILEGNISGTGNNVVVYATSNRRHLVKESMDDRNGDDLHLNDTLQETMSLASRFGLTITFMKPAKDEYLSIVENMALERGLAVDEDLFTRAEAFAIRMNGRSPRTAKQFITQALIGLQ